ncbi:MAG: hypothetical protein AAF984_04660 [Verrucomicrobiota bacterium]
MSAIGWIIMLAAVGGTTTFFLWCIARVLSKPGLEKRMHGPVELDTPDTHEED